MNKKINHALQTGYIRRYTLSEGKENGLRIIELNNGILRVLLNESKGLDIMQVWHKGVNMSFVSKNGFTARELPFLKRFEGGMLYTCGLDSIGGREGFELHGSFHNTPAAVTDIDNQNLRVSADIEVTSLFGENLVMKRTVSLTDGKLQLEDTLVNRGTKDENYCLLYHINFGYPFLDEGVQVEADIGEVIPRTPKSAEASHERTSFIAPVDNEEERCYFLENNGNSISAVNKKLGVRATVSYSKDTLPCLIQWNSPASQDYALGLEPATCRLDDGFCYKQIAPQEQVRFAVLLAFNEV